MKTYPWRPVATALLVAALALPASAAESPSLLLQKAIYAEETEGNLDAAIKLYQQITVEAAANRVIFAQAQYRLALCYQKKGDKAEAIKLLRGLIQPSPGLPGLHTKAREALVALGETPAAAMAVRQIPLPVAVGWVWDISPDGRLVSYQPMGPEDDVLVCDLNTQQNWTVFKGVKGKEVPFSNAMFSPDGRQIAFDVETPEGNAIYVANVDGSDRRLCAKPEGNKESMANLGWSPDGRFIHVGYFNAASNGLGTCRYGKVDVKTGAKTELAKVERTQKPDWWTPSTDFWLVARRKGFFPRTITVLDIQSGHEETVVPQDADRVLGWVPGESRFVYSAGSKDGLDLWLMTLRDGKPAGAPQRIWSNMAANAIGVGIRGGNIYYAVRQQPNVPWEFWVIEGALDRKLAVVSETEQRLELRPDEILAADGSIHDRTFGVRAVLPSGWSMQSANLRRAGARANPLLTFNVPVAGAVATLGYHSLSPWERPGPNYPVKEMGPRPTTPAEIDAWLNRWRLGREEGLKQQRPDRQRTTRPGSVASRTVNGHRTLVWTADLVQNGEPRVEFLAITLGEQTFAIVWMQIAPKDAEVVRTGFDAMVASLHVP